MIEKNEKREVSLLICELQDKTFSELVCVDKYRYNTGKLYNC